MLILMSVVALVTIIMLWLSVKPFGIFSPIFIYREYAQKTSEMAPIVVLLRFKKTVGRRSEKILAKAMKKEGYVFAEDVDMKVLRAELNLPPAMSIWSRIAVDGDTEHVSSVQAIHTTFDRRHHDFRTGESMLFGESDLYAAIPEEYARIRSVSPHRKIYQEIIGSKLPAKT